VFACDLRVFACVLLCFRVFACDLPVALACLLCFRAFACDWRKFA